MKTVYHGVVLEVTEWCKWIKREKNNKMITPKSEGYLETQLQVYYQKKRREYKIWSFIK